MPAKQGPSYGSDRGSVKSETPINTSKIIGPPRPYAAHADSLAYFEAIDPTSERGLAGHHAIINPETFGEAIEPEWSKRRPLGLSHNVLQYIGTGSRVLTMDLVVAAEVIAEKHLYDSTKGGVKAAMLNTRNFFQALTVPLALRRTPPLIKFSWPHAQTNFQGFIISLNIDYTRFTKQGMILEFVVDMEFLELAKGFMTFNLVRHGGFGSTGSDNAETQMTKESATNSSKGSR